MRNTVCLAALIALSVLCAVSVSLVWAEVQEPKDRIEQTIETIRSTVLSNKGKLSESALDKKLREIISPVFDFRTMSIGCLGTNWRKATAEQQTEFVDLFTELLARTYLKKIKEGIETSNISIVGDTQKDETKVVVKTIVERDMEQVTIDYRMRLKKDEWRVYDVIIENVGLVSNYRSEFAGIIRKEKMNGLLERLRNKEEG